MSELLVYIQKTVKTLTIENLSIENIFKKYEFPKLEALRFEYMQFYKSEDFFDFSILRRSVHNILALPSLKTLVFSQYQRYPFHYVDPFNEEAQRPRERLELVSEFWEEFRKELDKVKDKPLKIKYHKMDDANIKENVENFKRIFKELPTNQTFEYEIALSHEEIKTLGLDVPVSVYKKMNLDQDAKGTRYLIFLDKIESF